MYDDLWVTKNGTASWYDNATDDQKTWLEGLADKIIEKGADPVWTQVGKAFRETFDTDKPVDSTLTETVRRLVKQRG